MDTGIRRYYWHPSLGEFDTLAELEAAQAERDYKIRYACILQKFWRNILFKKGWEVCKGEIWVRHADYGTHHYKHGSCIFTKYVCERCRDETASFVHRDGWQYNSDDPGICQCHLCEDIPYEDPERMNFEDQEWM